MDTPGGYKSPDQIAEEIINKADRDFSLDEPSRYNDDELTRDTEVYSEDEESEESSEGDPEELNFDVDQVRDAWIGEDDF